MAIGKISGPMLYSNLERQGVNLAFDSNVLYLDVTNRFVGANTSTPNAELQVVGNANIGNLFIHGNTITSITGVLDFGSNANITITGGEVGRVLTTDGFGTLTWELVSSLATGFGNITINQNTITTTNLDGNLELTANGNGVVTTLTHDFYAANVFTSNLTANYINGNVRAADIIATGNITAPYFIGNLDSTTVTATGNVTAPYFIGNVEGYLNGNVNATTVDATGNITAPYFVGNVTASTVDVSGNVVAPYFIGNLEGNVNGNVAATSVVATGNIDAAYFNGNLRATDVISTGNVLASYFVGNLDGTVATLTGNVTAPYFIGNVEGYLNGNVNATTVTASGNVAAPYFVGNVDSTTVTATGNITAPYFIGNLEGTTVNTTGNITAPYVLAEFVGNLTGDVAGNVTGNVSATTVDATGNITAPWFVGNVDSTTVTATGNITAPYVIGNVEGNVNAMLITSGNVNADYFNGNLRGTDVIAGNISSGNSYITATAVGLQDILISGNTISSLTTDLVLSANQTDPNNIIRFDSVSAFDIPAGTTAQRPPNPNFGYMRVNTDITTIEFWGGADWIPITSGITNQVILPDGINDTYTLDQITTTAGILVNINGTIQQADVAYSIAGDQITFAEIPLTTDIVEVRYLSAGVVSAPFNGGTVFGNVIPGANVTYSLGDDTHWWKSLYVSGSTIYIGGTPISIVDGALQVNNAPVSGGATGADNELRSNVGSFYTWANNNFGTNSYSNATVSAYLISQKITSANIGAYQVWANSNFGTSTYSNSNVAAYLIANPQSGTYSNVNVQAYLGANIGAYQVWANANVSTLSTAVDTINSNIIAANLVIQNLSANIGTLVAGAPGALDTLYELGNALGNSDSFSSTMVNWLGNITSNVTAANTNISNINANIGSYQTWANSNFGTSTYSNTNVVAYLNSNITTGNVNIINGNLYVGTTNPQVPTTLQKLKIYSGGYGATPQSPYMGFVSTQIQDTDGYGIYLRSDGGGGKVVLSSNGENGAVAVINGSAYLSTTQGAYTAVLDSSGNLTLGGTTGGGWIVAPKISTTGNIKTIANVIAPNYLFANGVNILSTVAGTYSNTNVAAYLTGQNITSANIGAFYAYANANFSTSTYSNTDVSAYLSTATITTTGNITAGNIITSGTYTVANIVTTGTGGDITGANVISANTIQASKFNFANGVNILSTVAGTYSNTNVAAYLTSQDITSANIGTLYNSDLSINANLGAFQTYANANLLTCTTNFNTLDANVGAFETYANTKIGTNNNSNLVVVATTTSTSTTTGALVVKGGAAIAGNLNVGGTINATSGLTGIPTFHAYRSVQQTFTNGQWTKFAGNLELFDTSSSYDSATNFRFLPTVAGYYQMNISIQPIHAGTGSGYVGFYKNGTVYKTTYFYCPTGANYLNGTCTALVYLNGSTDYIEPYFYFTNATVLNADQTVNYFEGYLVRGA